MRVVQSIKHTKRAGSKIIREGWVLHYTDHDSTVSMRAYVCVCVRPRERELECVCLCVSVCLWMGVWVCVVDRCCTTQTTTAL